ncbi:unnamed protein product [Phytophthora fragariaefolia]|uniref:Unnamed protein product n=1 Tax=Phytophthora fragariaefolia TaxID=1490495 RepID=A0A9W6YN03_9STRA|nr:unnamed protein product [Phytophthora fragariaefolia]
MLFKPISSGAGEAASEASDAPGGVFSGPVVSQPRRDGRPTRAASTTAGLRSMAAAENEAALDALVLALMTPSSAPATTQASAASLAATSDPTEAAAVVAAASAAVVTSVSASPRVASTYTGPVPPARVVAALPSRSVVASRAPTVVTATLFTMPGTHTECSLAQPIVSDRVTECSVAGIQAFDDWEDPAHPWQRLRARLPKPPSTFGADDFMPNKPISIRASGLAIVVKLWLQFAGRAVERTEHSDFGFALWERAHWTSVAAVEQWLQRLSDRIGSDTPEYLETEAAWRAYNKARNLRAVSGSKSPSGSGSGAPRMPMARSSVRQRSCWSLRCYTAADSSAAADSPPDTSSARTPIPAADQADVQAELGDNASAQDGLNVLGDLASTTEI